MYWLEKYKALIITALISGILILSGFSIHVNTNNFVAETFYDLEPLTEQLPQEDVAETKNATLPKSNTVHNEDEAFKKMMRNFKTVDAPKENKIKAEETKAKTTSSPLLLDDTAPLNKKDVSEYDALNKELNKRLNNKANSKKSNTKSTVSFSLKGRALINDISTPRYLCETGGKVMVTIEVNAAGYVNKAFVNSKNTINECLKSYAITYAKDAKFNTSDLELQTGTITFIFEAKR